MLKNKIFQRSWVGLTYRPSLILSRDKYETQFYSFSDFLTTMWKHPVKNKIKVCEKGDFLKLTQCLEHFDKMAVKQLAFLLYILCTIFPWCIVAQCPWAHDTAAASLQSTCLCNINSKTQSLSVQCQSVDFPLLTQALRTYASSNIVIETLVTSIWKHFCDFTERFFLGTF